MKGFVITSVLAAVLFRLKWLFAKRAAKTDPVDIEALKKVDYRRANGNGGGGSR